MINDTDRPSSKGVFLRRLREQGKVYHPFNVMLIIGTATAEQFRGWAATRFTYQVAIRQKSVCASLTTILMGAALLAPIGVVQADVDWGALARKTEMMSSLKNLLGCVGKEAVGYTSAAICIDEKQEGKGSLFGPTEACILKYQLIMLNGRNESSVSDVDKELIQSRLLTVLQYGQEMIGTSGRSLRSVYANYKIPFVTDLNTPVPEPEVPAILQMEYPAWIEKPMSEWPDVTDDVEMKGAAIRELVVNLGLSGRGMTSAVLCIDRVAKENMKGKHEINPVTLCMSHYDNAIRLGEKYNAHQESLLEQRMALIMNYSADISRAMRMPIRMIFDEFDIPYAIGSDKETYIE